MEGGILSTSRACVFLFLLELCRFLKIRNRESRFLLPFLRGIELKGIDSFEESIPSDESIPYMESIPSDE